MSDLPPPPPDDLGSPPPPPPGGDAYGGPQEQKGWATTGTGESLQLAGVGARIGARVIDAVIVIFAWIILAVVGIADAAGTGSDSDDGVGDLIMSALIGAVIGLLYEVTMIATRGQTLGKMATKVMVVRADNGLVPGWGKSVGRWIIPAALSFIPNFGPILSLLVYISLLWDRRRQGWHDKAAGTLVVKA